MLHVLMLLLLVGGGASGGGLRGLVRVLDLAFGTDEGVQVELVRCMATGS